MKCKLCPTPGTTLAYHGGTTCMKNHLASHHKKEYASLASDGTKSQPTIQPFLKSKDCSTERANKITRLIAEMVVRDLRPINIVEGDGFTRLLNFLEPYYKVPSHTHITKVCRDLYTEQKEKLKEDIEKCGHVALTSDIWTSSAVDGYITLTAHFITDWQLHTRVLTTAGMPERHTGVNIADRMTDTVKEWGIASTLVSALVHDNAANAVNAAELTDWSHFGCVCHTLQLAIKSGLEASVINRVILAGRKLVGHFKHSVVAMTALKQKQDQLGIKQHHLVQDVVTRWNSTYFMMERLSEQRVAIYTVLHDPAVTKDDKKHLDLKEDQWELLSQMVTVLKPLQVATTVFSLEQNASCSIVYPVINGLLTKHLVVEEPDLPAIKNFKRNVSNQLKKRFKPNDLDTAKSLPVLCAAIDPRHSKLTFLTEEQRKITYDEIIDQAELLKIESCIAEPPPAKKKSSAMDFLLGDTGNSVSLTTKDEMDRFIQEPIVDHDSNVLEWWRRNEERFYALSVLAKKLFCIPATSVPSERIFSIAGNIITKKRASLKPDNLDMLVFLHKNLK